MTSFGIGSIDRYGLENPKSILQWSKETFGERTAYNVAIRTSREVNELVVSILYGESLESIREELADCAIMLWQVAELLKVAARPALGIDSNRPYICVERLALILQKRMTTVLEELHTLREDDQQFAETVLMDALRLLETLATHYKVDLPGAVDTKMGVNRERLWVKQANGAYQHAATGNNHALSHPAE
jgi:NTP pyrophosphatase (non-canonical NTP hydrolase)